MSLQVHSDKSFHYETMRALGTIPYWGADLREVLNIMDNIKPGDFESWYNEWFKLAQRVLATIDETKEDSYSPITLRDVYFRASHYIFVADFFLHGNKHDARIPQAYELMRKYFDKANALLPIPGIHVQIPADGFHIDAMVFRASIATESNPRPTLIIGGGFESIKEETFHDFGVAALERGYNVVLYEGPGHRSLIERGQGFIAEWEKAVSPVVDYLFAANSKELSFIDTSKLGLCGMSLGGYLAARAAAFEPRLSAVILVDGVWDLLVPSFNLCPNVKDAWEKQDKVEFDRLFEADQSSWATERRWFHDDLLYTFNVQSRFDAFQIAAKMNLDNGIAQKIKVPTYVGDAQDDIFFKGQPSKVAAAIGSNASLRKLGPEGLGASLHCASGALVYQNQDMFEWLATVVGH